MRVGRVLRSRLARLSVGICMGSRATLIGSVDRPHNTERRVCGFVRSYAMCGRYTVPVQAMELRGGGQRVTELAYPLRGEHQRLKWAAVTERRKHTLLRVR
jgi:hypothetical protein